MRNTLLLASLAVTGFIACIGTANEGQPVARKSAATTVPQQTVDEMAIRMSAETFCKEFNAGNAKGIAAQFTTEADWMDSDGQSFHGRDAIEQEFAASIAQNPGRKIEIAIDSIRFISPNVAVEDGSVQVTPPPPGPPGTNRYTVVHVKQDGRWLAACVRESRSLRPSNYEHLKDLEWMIGSWVDEGEDSVVLTSYRWAENKNYILSEFTVRIEGLNLMGGTLRIGWDPVTNQIRSWVFDTEGGYGEGLWTRDGNRWIVQAAGVLPDGRTASATNIYTLVDDDTIGWQSTERTVGGEAAPEIEVTIVRRPPQPM